MSRLGSKLLGALRGIEHGFGTRNDGYWTPLEQTAKLHQVHGRAVIRAEAAGHLGDGDALMTAKPGIWLEIRTADCVPLLIADPVRRVVAAVHAGWRGTEAAIAAEAVRAMGAEWGCEAGDLQVAIGPSIGVCCFEVGDEVAAHFPGHITQRDPRAHVDLVSANREQLMGAGVATERIDTLGLCTTCDAGQFYSFRRDRGEGRMVTAIRLVL